MAHSIESLTPWQSGRLKNITTQPPLVDGVYESLLDGLELEELRTNEYIDIKHYLMIDGRYTWWDCGRSYLCRIVDMLHMGYVDEVLVGREVVERLPSLVEEWASLVKQPSKANLENPRGPVELQSRNRDCSTDGSNRLRKKILHDPADRC